MLLDGKVELLRRAGREVSRVGAMERPGVWAGGFRAWNDAAGYMATGRGATPGRMFRVPASAFGEWARSAFPLGAHIIAGVFQTVRTIEANASQRESLVALGTLAAGLAHEINNPASATARAAKALEETYDRMFASLTHLAEQALTADQFLALEALRGEIGSSSTRIDPVTLADREEELTDWLAAHHVAEPWRIAPVLAGADAGVEWCERVREALSEDTLGPGLSWVASTLSSATLFDEMRESTSRVTALVSAVKSYSQVDRASVQRIDVTEGLESTLVVMHAKLGEGVVVERAFGADVPQIEAHPGELNQVWTNLIDNAIDAMDGRGTLQLVTRAEPEHVVVEVIDSGPGMPSDVAAHAFEPFFTTKEVSKGTGLGLDICRRIVVEQHGGAIEIDSRPGTTVLRVRLPRSGGGRRA